MIGEILDQGKARMEEVIVRTKKAFASVRTGRANPALLDRIVVNYYGTPTPLNQMASVTVPEPRMLVITPWDKSAMKDIEKAILTSDLGLVPNNDGSVIRLAIPPLTEERRKELVRLVRKDAEDHRVAVRNIRRDLNEAAKKLEKDGDISEDELRRAQEEIQKLTDRSLSRSMSFSRRKRRRLWRFEQAAGIRRVGISDRLSPGTGGRAPQGRKRGL
jgi:ribosome recycling factor